jgi:vacuolar-type H+-ATPase subunit H
MQNLLRVEKEARRIIAQAEKDAAAAIEKAREKARQIAAAGRDEARRQADELLSATDKKLEARRGERLERERAALSSTGGPDRASLEAAADIIVRAVAHGEASLAPGHTGEAP